MNEPTIIKLPNGGFSIRRNMGRTSYFEYLTSDGGWTGNRTEDAEFNTRQEAVFHVLHLAQKRIKMEK